MEITLTFGLSFSLKHSFQTQLYNHSRHSWLNIADVCFSLFDTISLSDWITLYCLSLLDMNFTRWLIYTPLFFTLLLSKVTKYPGSKEQISRSWLSKSEHCPQGKNSKTRLCLIATCSCEWKNNRKQRHKPKSCFRTCSIELVFISYSLLAIQEFCSVLLFFHNSSPEYSWNRF